MAPSISFTTETSSSQSRSSIYTRPAKSQKMSITQAYFLAHSARGKLSREAARGDHNLRLLVGHANMLDSLMLDLANAEQEQERWFNKSIVQPKEESKHEAPIMEEEESSDEEEEISSVNDMEVDEDETSGDLSLSRTQSRRSSPPPLDRCNSDSDDEDEELPLAPSSLQIRDFALPAKDHFAIQQQSTVIAAY